MSGTNTTKEFNSHTSRETESSYQARPQRNSSITKSRRVAAPKKSSSMAKAPVTSAAAAERTRRPSDIGNLQPNSLHARLAKQKELQDAIYAKAAQEAAEMKRKREEERKKRDAQRKEIIAKKRYHPDPRFDTSYMNRLSSVSDDATIEPQGSSATKKGIANDEKVKKTNSKKRTTKTKKPKALSTSPPVSTYSKNIKSTTTEQQELPNAESDSASTETAPAPHDTSSSSVPASASGDAQDSLNALRTCIRDGFFKLTFSQFETFIELLNEYCNLNLNPDDEVDLNDIPEGRLQIFATWTRGCLSIKDLAANNAGDLEHLQGEATQTEAEQTEQPGPQLEKLPLSALADSANKHGKRSLDDEDDDQVASEDSDIHRSKKARSSEPDSNPREDSARTASLKGSIEDSAMLSSTQSTVTVNAAAVNGGFIPAVTGGMIPFGAVGHAAQKYHDFQEQLFNEQYAKFEKRESEKQVPKRSASEAQLDEPFAKKIKQSEDEMALRNEVEQAMEEPVAQAKTFKQEDIMEKPEVASSTNTDYATPVHHNNQTSTGEVASAAETEPTTKEKSDSTNNEENKSPSSSGDSGGEKKAAEKTSTTGSATIETSSPTEHQDVTKIIDKTSQTSDEESVKSHSNEIAATTMNQEEVSHSKEAESSPKTQDGLKSVKVNASMTTSGSVTTADTQQETAHKSKKDNAQDRVAKASKKSAKNSDNIDTNDQADSGIETPANRKPASNSGPNPQSSVKANNDQHAATNKQGSNRRKKSCANPVSSAQDKKKSTSKAPAIKKPSAATQKPRATGPEPERFNLGPNKFTEGHQAAPKRPLADKTNIVRQPTKPGPKKTSAASANTKSKAPNKPSAPVKSAASKKRKLDQDDVTESAELTEKKQRAETNRKRSRENEDKEEDEEDDVGSIKKHAKRQRTSPSSTSTSMQPDRAASVSFSPDRASRSKAAREKKAAADAGAIASRQRATQAPGYNHDLPSDGYDTDDETTHTQPQRQAQRQAAGFVDEDEQTQANEKKDEQTNEDKAEHEVGVNDTNDAQRVPAIANAATQPRRRPGAHIALSTASHRPQIQRAPNNRSKLVKGG